MSLQLRVAIEIGETSQSDAEYARLDHRESVIPAGAVEPENLGDFIDLASATLERMLADIGERASAQLAQISQAAAP